MPIASYDRSSLRPQEGTDGSDWSYREVIDNREHGLCCADGDVAKDTRNMLRWRRRVWPATLTRGWLTCAGYKRMAMHIHVTRMLHPVHVRRGQGHSGRDQPSGSCSRRPVPRQPRPMAVIASVPDHMTCSIGSIGGKLTIWVTAQDPRTSLCRCPTQTVVALVYLTFMAYPLIFEGKPSAIQTMHFAGCLSGSRVAEAEGVGWAGPR
jgi:hypothetical protein